MDNSDVLQRNAAGELEVRVVNGTEKADAPANYDDVFTVNSEGKRALRVVGAGGGGGSGGLETVSHDETLSGNGTTNSPLSVVNPVPSDGTTGQVLIKTADGIEWADAATGGVTSVNGVQPVDGNVDITGDNITATVGEEEATITQHLTTLKNDDAAKVNIAQGADNAGKVMTVGADGNVEPTAGYATQSWVETQITNSIGTIETALAEV